MGAKKKRKMRHASLRSSKIEVPPGKRTTTAPNPPVAAESLTAQQAEALARLAAIVTSSEDAIVSKDLNGVITTWNKSAEQMFGYTSEEAVGMPVAMLIPQEHLDEEPRILDRIRRGEVIEHYETVRKRKDGTLLNISLTVSPIKDAAGKIIGASKIARDVTERHNLQADLKRRNEELAEADRTKNKFIATLSHELRSPLNAIRSWVQIISRPGTQDEDLRKGVEVIDRNSKALADLISDLLDVHGMAMGKIRLDVVKLDLRDVVHGVHDSMAPAAADKEIHIELELGPAPVFVMGDATRLQQVLSNLLGNAIKFTPKGGHVRIALRQKGTRAELSVSDTGKGIGKTELEHIFEPFRQADALSSRVHHGLGLGLAISKRLMELHGGSISVQSPGQGNGATFTISLLLLDAELARPLAVTQATRLASSVSLGGIFVLVVEDEADARLPLQLTLEAAGAETAAVASAEAALVAIRQRIPDVIVSDIGLPGKDGYALMRSVRALPAGSGGNVPAIALTGYAAPEDRERSRAAGFLAHLAKPVEPERLLAAVASLASRREAPARTVNRTT